MLDLKAIWERNRIWWIELLVIKFYHFSILGQDQGPRKNLCQRALLKQELHSLEKRQTPNSQTVKFLWRPMPMVTKLFLKALRLYKTRNQKSNPTRRNGQNPTSKLKFHKWAKPSYLASSLFRKKNLEKVCQKIMENSKNLKTDMLLIRTYVICTETLALSNEMQHILQAFGTLNLWAVKVWKISFAYLGYQSGAYLF